MLKNGTILEIPLEKNYGYAYAKLLFLDVKINNLNNLEPIMKIYNLFSKNQMKINSEDFKNIDYKSQSIIPMDSPKLRGKKKWKIIGCHNPSIEDDIIPEFKSNFSLINADCDTDISLLNWFITKNLDPTNRVKVNSYQEVKHLGAFIHMRHELISHKLTFDWMHHHGIEPLDIYNQNDFNNIIGLSMMYAISKSEV